MEVVPLAVMTGEYNCDARIIYSFPELHTYDRFFLWAAIFKMIPTDMSAAIRAVPPWLMNGSGKPVSGAMPNKAPIFRNAENVIKSVNPAATKRPNIEDAPLAIMSPRSAKATKSATRSTVPTKPNSSPYTAKTESD